MNAPSTSWATWAWEAYKDGRLVEVSSDTATWNAAIREAAELLGEAAKNQTPARAETVKACGRAILALLKEEKE